jgi:hypothetical protein
MTSKKESKSYIQLRQERDVIACMRDSLSDDGLCHVRTKDIGAVVGGSKPTGSRILERLRRDQTHIWVVVEATNRDGIQYPYGIFPWRGAASHQLIENNQGSKMNPYVYMVGGSSTVCGGCSGSYKGFSYSDVVAGSFLNPALPPAWALTLQSASAQARLDALNVRLSGLLNQYGPDAWTTPMQVTSAQIDFMQDYIADLKVWNILAGVQ